MYLDYFCEKKIMRHRDCEIERDNYIFEIFEAAIINDKNKTVSSIIDDISLLSPSRLYVDKERIAEIIYLIRKGKFICPISLKYKYIYNMYLEAIKIAPKASVLAIAEVIEMMPSPSFYLSRKRIKDIIHKKLRE